MPNLKNPIFVGATDILVGLRGVGASKKFHVDISSVMFLGPVPLAHTTKGEYPELDPCLTNQVDLSLSPSKKFGQQRARLGEFCGSIGQHRPPRTSTCKMDLFSENIS